MRNPDIATRQKHEQAAIFQRKMCELRMFLRIVGARSAEQFDIIDIIDIIEAKIPFDINIILWI